MLTSPRSKLIAEDCMLPEDGPQRVTKRINRKLSIYDDEWLKLVLAGLCPECDGLLEKKGLLRVCSKYQHLHILKPYLCRLQREKA